MIRPPTPGVPGQPGLGGVPAADAPVNATAPGHEHHGSFKHARFSHVRNAQKFVKSSRSGIPLRSAGPKRRKGAKSVGSAAGDDDHESGFESNEIDRDLDSTVKVQAHAETRDGDTGSGEQRHDGRGERRRFDKLIRLTPRSADTASDDRTRRSGNVALRLADPPLPPMKTMHDVISFIHAATLADPSGQSLGATLRKINAAVLSKRIDIARVNKVSDTREAMIAVFGTGHAGNAASAPILRSIHAMLPLWLINLGRQRTDTQQTHAAARMTVPRRFA